MQAVSQPDIHVDREAAGADGSDCLLPHWHRMVFERLPETRIQPNTILPKAWLVVVDDVGKGDRILDEGAVVPRLSPVFPLCEECQPASGNPASLLGDELIGLAARCGGTS
jgi:hypothetical protein